MYYTNDHEWIDFLGAVAYVGVSNFKLLGFRKIHKISFFISVGFAPGGNVLASIRYNDFLIEVHMPVDGIIIEINEILLTGTPDEKFQHLEKSGWIFKINPTRSEDRQGLIPSLQYHRSQAQYVITKI